MPSTQNANTSSEVSESTDGAIKADPASSASTIKGVDNVQNSTSDAELKSKGSSPASTSKPASTSTQEDKTQATKPVTTAPVGAEDANGGIVTPHDHDVLSGRGNSVNHHPGNEYFRSLVRHHKLAYVRCPKPQKEQFSKLIVSTVRDREPPGRFLKQNSTTKMWYNIGTQKALDKTRQALREGAPATVAGLMLSQGLTPSAAAAAGLTPSQAVSTLSSVSGDNEMLKTGGNAAVGPNGSNNPFLSHHPQQHAHSHHSAAHHAAAAAVAASRHQQQQHQHNAAMAAAHTQMVNNSYYNAAAAAAAATGAGVPGVNYPNSPKPPMTASSSGPSAGNIGPDGNTSDPALLNASHKSAKKAGAQPSPQSPPQHPSNPRLPPSAAPPPSSTYPPLPPPSNPDDAMKYHAAQVVRMATAQAATGSNPNSNGSSSGGGFGNSAALAAAAGTFNPVLLEHIMSQQRGSGGSASIPPQSGGSGMDWNSSRQPPPSSGGRGGGEYQSHQYSGYPPPPNNGQQQHEDIHAKCQRQEAYIAHLQDRIQQQERQLLTLCSHILLSPPPPGGNVNVSVNPTPGPAGISNPLTGSTSAGSNVPPPGTGGVPRHNGLSHPQFAAAAKMNAATAVANINATAAAVKELQSYAGAAGSNTNASSIVNDRASTQPHHGHNPRLQHASTIAAAVAASATNSTQHKPAAPPLPIHYAPPPTLSSIATAPSQTPSSSATASAPPSGKPVQVSTTNYGNGHANAAKEKASNSGAASTAGTKSPTTPTQDKLERPTDDGDAVAALLSLGIGGTPSPSPATSTKPTEPPAAEGDEGSSKKKRKLSATGRRSLPLKKKQIQQQENNKSNNYHQSSPPPPQQPQHPQPPQQRQQQQQQQNALPINSMIMQNNRAVIPKPPGDMGAAPELYLYGETPIHEPHVHDVLCGRGALTNEHPGNEWFRRLVRSNRQLYRSCPKHTKLLVAKAIVQAVQRTQRNPPGRFLEKTKTADGSVSNTWTPITYKSAVEKASQALREKVTPNWGAPPSNFPLSKALEAARAVAYLEKEYPSGDGFGGTNLLALIMAVVQSAGLD